MEEGGNTNRRLLSKSQAGHLGALARMHKHGNPGTILGRSKGGFRSLATHAAKNTGFKVAKQFNTPDDSVALAEFMGILVGDGHLSKYQASISTSSETDLDHAEHIIRLARSLFGIAVPMRYKKESKAVEIVISSVALIAWLERKGMPRGNKMEKGLSIPAWIATSKEYQRAFLRGLFDTDGCIYLDRHTIRGKTYQNLGWTITSYSGILRNEIFALLRAHGFNPSMSPAQRSVYMRRRKDVERYFSEIGTSNSKHERRFQAFKEKRIRRSG